MFVCLFFKDPLAIHLNMYIELKMLYVYKWWVRTGLGTWVQIQNYHSLLVCVLGKITQSLPQFCYVCDGDTSKYLLHRVAVKIKLAKTYNKCILHNMHV